MACYEGCDTFDIDDGELDDLSAQEIFCLGVEWAMFRRVITQHRSDLSLIHRANGDRLISMLQGHGLRWSLRTIDNTWAEIEWSHD